nr:unnamed protein product [Digitaria exilis]
MRRSSGKGRGWPTTCASSEGGLVLRSMPHRLSTSRRRAPYHRDVDTTPGHNGSLASAAPCSPATGASEHDGELQGPEVPDKLI